MAFYASGCLVEWEFPSIIDWQGLFIGSKRFMVECVQRGVFCCPHERRSAGDFKFFAGKHWFLNMKSVPLHRLSESLWPLSETRSSAKAGLSESPKYSKINDSGK